MNIIKVLIIIVFTGVIVTPSYAFELSPYEVVKSTGNTLFSRISNNQQKLEKFPALMRTIVEEELMPNVDYKYAAYKMLGKNLKHSTKEQRRKFVDAVRLYLVKTYAIVLNKYSNQTVIYEPIKPSLGKKIVAVKLVVISPSAPEINLVFNMRKNKKTSEWKAFDIVVEGISLLQSKQSEISRKIANMGIEQVAIELAYLRK
jgi:phospholipid transport system substrate-binding protein